jgi:signal transduction histidine kinase
MKGGRRGGGGFHWPSQQDKTLERRLLPSVAERGRLGLLLLVAANFVPLVADRVAGDPNFHALSPVEIGRIVALALLAALLPPTAGTRRAGLVTLAGIAVMGFSSAWIAGLRADPGPYMIVTVGLALGCAVGVGWSIAWQTAAAVTLTVGLGVALLRTPQVQWTSATTSTVFAYVMSMAASVLMAHLESQRRKAAAEALARTLAAGETLRELNENLEQRIDDRTKELAGANSELANTNKRLATINRDLEAAYRELEGFTHSVSHDLRVPLRVINGLSRLALEEHGHALGDEGRGYLGRIGDEAIKLGEIGDDLLTLARVTRVPVSLEDVDVSSLAHKVVAEIRGSAPDRPVGLRIESGVVVAGDPALLANVLEQLLANAWKFTRHRADPVIELGRWEEPGTRGFYVRDNGDGFDPGFAGKLFGRFERIHDDKDLEGRGIGLAIAQRIIHRHGGTIRAEGGSGKGATFFVSLPG